MIPFSPSAKSAVTPKEMEDIYEKIKTPHKVGAVMKWENHLTDSATVFQKDGVFYMYFIAIAKDTRISGYETHLARSKDLLHWDYIAPIFRRNAENRWDSKQCAGYVAYPDIRFDGTGALQKINDSYYISYLAGNSDGYEPDPLYMGLAKSQDPTNAHGFQRFPAPMLRPDDNDVRPFETKTLYKSFLFRDELRATGYPYVNIYNAKGEDDRERIFLAVSDDGEDFTRMGERAVLDLVSNDPNGIITGDPQIVRIDDIYVMFFFRFRRGESAYNTFAASRDLVNWRVWDGEPLIKSEYEWENRHAHKSWFLRHENQNYHFYCAVNDKHERFIALATS
jgi:predicted GH43/DUF377 family glycosyl hydrolase